MTDSEIKHAMANALPQKRLATPTQGPNLREKRIKSNYGNPLEKGIKTDRYDRSEETARNVEKALKTGDTKKDTPEKRTSSCDRVVAPEMLPKYSKPACQMHLTTFFVASVLLQVFCCKCTQEIALFLEKSRQG